MVRLHWGMVSGEINGSITVEEVGNGRMQSELTQRQAGLAIDCMILDERWSLLYE